MRLTTGIAVVCGVLLAVAAVSNLAAVAQTTEGYQIKRAKFDGQQRAVRPEGYRGWVHVGTRIQTHGKNIIDGKEIDKPEILNAYVEPSAFEHFKQTGQWADGTQMVKEFTTVLTGKNYDSKSMESDSETGRAVHEDDFIGLSLMVKDRNRFPKENGYWGYFGFAHHEKPYPKAMKVAPTSQCAQCHNTLAKDLDYVFSNNHLVLRTILKARSQGSER